ncbi:hypothetical protein BC941DRAFT_440488, partial [Chlamydoabsidia padenii]
MMEVLGLGVPRLICASDCESCGLGQSVLPCTLLPPLWEVGVWGYPPVLGDSRGGVFLLWKGLRKTFGNHFWNWPWKRKKLAGILSGQWVGRNKMSTWFSVVTLSRVSYWRSRLGCCLWLVMDGTKEKNDTGGGLKVFTCESIFLSGWGTDGVCRRH